MSLYRAVQISGSVLRYFSRIAATRGVIGLNVNAMMLSPYV
jgi:hypothetical protein